MDGLLVAGLGRQGRLEGQSTVKGCTQVGEDRQFGGSGPRCRKPVDVFRGSTFPDANLSWNTCCDQQAIMTKPSNPLVRDLRRADVFIAVALIGLVLTSQRANAQAAYFGSSAESVGRFRLRELTQRMVQGDF